MSSDDDDKVDDDSSLFRKAMHQVRPLKHDARTRPPARRPKPVRNQRHHDEPEVMDDLLSDWSNADAVEAGEELLFTRPGLQHNSLRKLRRGQLSVSAELDLHGLNATEARLVLTDFLHTCRRQQQTCVRIIHGKGFGSRNQIPVLKNKVNGWLRQREEVLAFCSARPADGGTGAVYVLLKKR